MSLLLYTIINKYYCQLCCVTNNFSKSHRLTTVNLYFSQGLQVSTASHDFLFWNQG